MKTPKAAPKLERNALSTPSMKIRKNKKAGFQGKLDSKKAKLALDKSNPNVNVVDVKSVPKNSSPNSRPNAQVNGKTVAKSAPTSPVSANVGKNKKPNKVSPNATPQSGPQGKRKSKKGKEARSPEVQLGLKIEKLLESPKGGKQPGGGGGKKKKQKGATPGGPAQDGKPQAQPSSPGKGKKRKRNNKEKPDSPSAAVQNGSADPQGKQKPKQKPNKGKAPRIDEDAPISIGDFPNRSSIEGAVKSLLKEVEQRKQKTPALLGDSEPIHVVVTFFKAYSGGRRLQRILLPHTPHGADPDVIFFAPDMKKAKNDPEESIEYYTDLFREHGVTGISEIIPYRKVTKEYTQYEEKRKLINRSDVMLIDSRISHRWASIMRKSTARKKAPIPVRTLEVSNMKKNFDAAMKKTTVLCKDNSLELNLIVGQTTTKAPQLADNIATVASAFCDLQRFPGGQPNIRKIVVKTAKSDSFPVFVSTVSPNAVAKPKAPKKKKAEIVTGEVTSAGVTVAVHPDGKIKIKSKDVDLNETEHDTSPQKKRAAEKRKDVDSEDEDDDDESVMDEEESGDEDSDDDDVDPTTVKKFKLANKASDDETTDEEEIERAEQEFLLALRKQQNALEADAKAANTKAKKEASKSGKPVAEEFDDDDDESDEEDIESDDDEDSDDSDVPDLIPAKKPQSVQPQKGKGKPQGGKPKGSNGPAAGQKGKNQWQRKGGKGNSPQQKGGKGGSPQQKGKQGKPFQKGNKKPNNQQGSPKARYFNMKAGGKKK